jgi:hypothetical protein
MDFSRDMSSRPWDPAEEVLYDATHIHRVGAFGGSQFEGLAEYCGTSVPMIEQSYGRYIRKDFLGPLIAASPKTLGKAALAKKPDP